MISILGGELYQWDTGRIVKFEETGVQASELHFANKGDSKAVKMQIGAEGTLIPDYLLRTGKQLCVYAVDNGVTVEFCVFPVTKRERPEHYIYEEDQRNYIYVLTQKAEEAIEAAENVAQELRVARDNGVFTGPKGEKGDPGEAGKDATRASSFYTNLSAAIEDLNNGITTSAVNDPNSAVEVFIADNGKKNVRLLADVSESAQIDVTTDLALVLNGHTLKLTTAAAKLNFAAGTNCKINGEVEGSAIKKENITSTGNTNAVLVQGDHLQVRGGYYSIGGSFSAVTMFFGVAATCKVIELDGVEVSATNTHASTTKATKCIQSQAAHTILKNSTLSAEAQTVVQAVHVASTGNSVEIINSHINAKVSDSNTKATAECMNITAECLAENSTFVATGYTVNAVNLKEDTTVDHCHIEAAGFDAGGATVVSGVVYFKKSTIFTDAHGAHTDTGCSRSLGIISAGTVVCIDTDVTGTHTAVQLCGNLFVKGGTFSGYSHGGFYFVHEAEHQVYINNAILEVGVYHGSFEDFGSNDSTHRANRLAGFYLGNDELDSPGISVYMDGCTIEGEASEPFVVRSGAVGYTNTLYISNTTNNIGGTIRLNAGQTTNRAEMKIGIGCNFTPTDTSDPQWAEKTGKLYRRMKDDMPMDGRDFTALLAYEEAQHT